VRVLVADAFEPSGLSGLKAIGCEVHYLPDVKDDSLRMALEECRAEVLIVRSTRVSSAILDAGRLSLVVRAGAGTNTIDVAHASQRGIYVANCPGKNAIAVAELAFGLLLSIDRRIPDNVERLRAGQWEKKRFSKARGVHGLRLGLLGLGAIGVEMFHRAQAFGLDITAWTRRFDGEDRALTHEEALSLGMSVRPGAGAVWLAPTPEAVARRSDVLSVHLPLTPETRQRIGASVFSALPDGAIFLNTARGELVDYAALRTAVETRGLRVGLDVFESEPTAGAAPFQDVLAQHPLVYGTHHIGASTDQAQEAIAKETVRIVQQYMESGRVPNVVNLCTRTPASHMLVVRHLDRPGVLAHVFEHLRKEGINVQETENIIFAGAKAAVARINVDASPSDERLGEMLAGNPDIMDVKVIPLSAE